MQITPDRLLRGSLLTVVYLLGILGIAASGGGGGGGSGGDDGPISISYSGNTDPAVISRSNAARLVGNVLVGQAIIESSSGSAAKGGASVDTADQGIGLAQFPGRLTQKLRNAMQSSSSLVSRSTVVQARTDVDETEPCDNSGGSVHTTGFIEDNGTGTLTLEYINCREGDETLDGTVTVRINNFDFSIPGDVIYNFAILTLTSSKINVTLSGSIHSQVSFVAETEQLTVDRLVARNNATGEMIMITNQLSVIDYDNIFFPSSFSETITGRVFDSINGYVDFSTNLALNFGTMTQEYPDSGQLLLIGDLNSGIQVTVLSDTHSMLDLDLDGNSIFEIVAILNWPDLESGTNLADSDNDGIHDSWETENGLDPSDPTDAIQDADIDGYSNIDEYLTGSDPNDNSSIPQLADLSLSTDVTGAPIPGSLVNYLVTVDNLGPGEANTVELKATLTVDRLDIRRVLASDWSCSTAPLNAIVTCTLTSLTEGTAPVITIEVILPERTGSVSNTVDVTYENNDINPGDNSITVTTDLLPSTADLSVYNTAAPTGVILGGSLVYTLGVLNQGPSPAVDVVLTDTLPPGVTFVSATGFTWSCNESSGTVTCTSGRIHLMANEVDITVIPLNEGVYENIVTVSSGTLDPDISNNSATLKTAAGTSISTIQSEIEAASPGDTVLVDAGTYIGSLNFSGKDVTLRSVDGPENTIIHGNGSHFTSSAITIGPGAAIEGFTIMGAQAISAAGMRVNGSGTLISQNIFDNNTQSWFSSSGYGAAIGGDSSSPTIERNIFRNNKCGATTTHPSVVGFLGNSSPIIVNNVFEDNLCGAINMDLSIGNTPLVLNNTFKGNLSGIHVDRGVSQVTQIYRNNVIVENETGLAVTAGTELDNPIWENNLVFSNTIDYEGVNDQSWINGNISSDPLFVDAGNGNYRLQIGSPAIDTGNSVGAPSIDFDGTVRPLDGDGDMVPVVDMGAFEAPAL